MISLESVVNIGYFRYKYKYGIPIQPCLKVIFRNAAQSIDHVLDCIDVVFFSGIYPK